VKAGLKKIRLLRQSIEQNVLWEVLFVAGVGIVFGFLANSVSPKGLGLTTNYFPQRPTVANQSVTEASSAEHPAATQPGTNINTTMEISAAARLKQNGLQMVDGTQAWQLFNDPRHQQQLVVFIDARDDRHYSQGHIPGAYQFDHYHPEKYLAEILSACQMAEQIVVYCNGGDCEDSEYAAVMLRDAGVANQKLFVFSGGINEWTARHLPLETGSRMGLQAQ